MANRSGLRPKFDAANLPASEASSEETLSSGDDDFNVVVGNSIRTRRHEFGWTQATLAENAGLSPNYIARLERGELGPSLFVANRICKALTMPLSDLLPKATSGRTSRQPKTG